MVEFSPGVPVVIGILADVSGSMRSAIGSSGTAALNRLEAFSAALEDLVKQAATFARESPRGSEPTDVRLFAYGFGFGNPLSGILGRSGPAVRDLFAPGGRGERTVDVLDLANNWETYFANVRSMIIDMFGGTPMKAAFEAARQRLTTEASKGPSMSILFVLSDGEPTDGEAASIISVADDMRRAGTTIISCFVTDTDITEPQRLYGQYQDSWRNDARLMYDCSSRLENETPFRTQLSEYGWRVDENARLFSQVNQSEALNQFLSIVLSPLKNTKTDLIIQGTPATSEWYVSYAWGDDHTPEGRAREEIVDRLCTAAAAQGNRILRDKDVLSLGDRISTFMKRIGRGDRVFVILSDKYLRSPYCMFELSEIWRTSQQEGESFLKRVRIYALPDAKFFQPRDWADWAIYWKREHDALESRAHEHGTVVLGEQGHRRLTQMRNFYSQVSDILGALADIVQPRTFEDLERYGFNDLSHEA
jgi:internalin A